MAGRSPTVRRRRLASELRRFREEANLTIGDVAQRLACSESKISRIETAQVRATLDDVRRMLEEYGVDDARQARLLELAREARQKAWWHEYRLLFDTSFIGLENEASGIDMYGGQTIPGLLQTERYAREVLTALLPKHAEDEIERRVALRIGRQELLRRKNPVDLWAVIDEAALRRLVGGPEVMREQAEALVDAAELPSVTLQALPFDAGAHAGMDGDFTIMRFSESAHADVVYMDTGWEDVYLDEREPVRRYSLLFDYVRASALTPRESRKLFATLAKDHQRERMAELGDKRGDVE